MEGSSLCDNQKLPILGTLIILLQLVTRQMIITGRKDVGNYLCGDKITVRGLANAVGKILKDQKWLKAIEPHDSRFKQLSEIN